jgi:hypothetical protein
MMMLDCDEAGVWADRRHPPSYTAMGRRSNSAALRRVTARSIRHAIGAFSNGYERRMGMRWLAKIMSFDPNPTTSPWFVDFGSADFAAGISYDGETGIEV